MTTAGMFTHARFAGPIFGADLKHHDLFKVERAEGPPIYGEYFLISASVGDGEFGIGIRLFGYIDRFNVGNLHRRARLGFTADECSAAEKVIDSFFSNPNVFDDKFLRPIRCSGGIKFQPNWIIQKPPEPDWLFPRPSNSDDPIYLGDFLGDASTGVVTNIDGQVFNLDDIAAQIRGMPVDEKALMNVNKIVESFSADATGKDGHAVYRGSVGALSAREVALRDANRKDFDIIDKTERGRLLINEGVIDAVRDLLVKFYQFRGLDCLAAIEAAHRAIGPEPDFPKVAGQPPQLHRPTSLPDLDYS